MKIDNIWLDCKFLEFLYGEIRFLIVANLLNLEPFGLSFPNGGSIYFMSFRVGHGGIFKEYLCQNAGTDCRSSTRELRNHRCPCGPAGAFTALAFMSCLSLCVFYCRSTVHTIL